jgi:alpha/beta superfamily hydrolase
MLLLGCTQTSNPVVLSESDSVLSNSIKLQTKSSIVLKMAEHSTEQKVKQVILKVYNLQDKVNDLKKEMKTVKSTIIRDTIIITEKKNFWGKKKVTVDSSHSVIEDSTTN